MSQGTENNVSKDTANTKTQFEKSSESSSSNKDKIVDAQSPTATWRATAGQSEFTEDPNEDDLDDSLTSLNWLHSMQGSIQVDSQNDPKHEALSQKTAAMKEEPSSKPLKSVIPVKSIAKTATRAPPNRAKNLANAVATAAALSHQGITILPTKSAKPASRGVPSEVAGNRTVSGKTMAKKVSITTIPAKREVTTIVNGNLGLTSNLGLNRAIGLAGRNGSTQGSGFVPAVLSRAGTSEHGTADFVPYPMTHLMGHHSSTFSPQLSTSAKGSDAAQLLDDPDVSKYKYNHLIKPPFSYTTLICMAMKARGASGDGKIVLNHLLSWVADNFSYYKHSDPAWQNNVYHALATNKCFEKVSMANQINSVGSFHEELSSGNSVWSISPAHQTEVDSMFKKKRSLQQSTSSTSNHLKKPRFTPSTMLDPNSVFNQQIGILQSTQSAPARSKRKQCVPEDIHSVSRRSNSSGPLASTNPAGYSGNNAQNCYTMVPNAQSNRKLVSKQLLGSGSVPNMSGSVAFAGYTTNSPHQLQQSPGKMPNSSFVSRQGSTNFGQASNYYSPGGTNNIAISEASHAVAIKQQGVYVHSFKGDQQSSLYNITNSACSLPPLNGGLSNGVKSSDTWLTSYAMENNALDFSTEAQEETLVTEQDCLLMSMTDEDILSQIDDLFFDISPPQSHPSGDFQDHHATTANNSNGLHFDPNLTSNNVNQQQQYASFVPTMNPQQTGKSLENLAVHGSRIEPPLNWSPSPRQMLIQCVPKGIKTEPLDPDLTASSSSWLQCSQTSLSLSNNSDWLRDSHERIMKGGQLSEEELDLSGHGLQSRKDQMRYLTQPEGFCQPQPQTLEYSSTNHVAEHITDSINNHESFPTFMSGNDFSSPRMLDLSCLPEPLA